MINNKYTNWKREWEEEQIPTPEEQDQEDRDKAELDQIQLDLLMVELDREEEEEDYREYVASSDPFDDYDFESEWEEYHGRDEYAGQVALRGASMESQGSAECPVVGNDESPGPDQGGTCGTP